MRAVMLAMQPKWCEKIANEEKTIEVRKTAPKQIPFKVYIYCTNTPQLHHLYDLRHVNGGTGKIRLGCVQHNKYSLVAAGWLNGKVIGEFVCDSADWMSIRDCDKACMTLKDAIDYGKGKKLYAWHISELKIYDEPKELHEFKIECPKTSAKRDDCAICPFEYYEPGTRVPSCDAYLKRPPQSWQYVEELEE